MRTPRFVIALLTALVMLPIALAPQPAAAEDLYTTEGLHHVNGRDWRTHCESYSATRRCWTEIIATTVTYADGRYTSTTDWTFNNLTYAASPRSLWTDNPLGAHGRVGGVEEWTGDDGRQWRTECDTDATGGNGCRSYAMSKVAEAYQTPAGTTAYRNVTKWVFNNMVRFTPAPPRTGDALDLIVDPALRGCVAEAVVRYGSVDAITSLRCDSRGIRSLQGLPAMPRLADLSLMGNALTTLAGLPSLPALEWLDASGNALSGTLELGALPRSVTELNLSRNAYTRVAGSLPGLKRAFLEANRITDVAGIVGSTGLTTLDLGANAVADASALGRLTGLQYLNLHHNRLTTVAGLTKLPDLMFLYLHGNAIRSVDGLQSLSTLEELYLAGNPMADLAVLKPLHDRGCTIDVWP